VTAVTLTTDFGLKDPYVAEMKAAILGICPAATIVDVTHLVEKFNVREGAFMLASAAPYFPEGTIHVAVVDPGVGTQRHPIIIHTKRGFFVGPDNGLMALAAEAQGVVHVRHIESRRLMLSHVSGTFHGRDIFAPAAAHLANGVPLAEFGPQLTEFVKPSFAKVSREKDTVVGEVLNVDDFGNIITNIPSKDTADFQGLVQVELPHTFLELKLSQAYGNVKPQEPLVLVGSHGYLEIALNQGSAAAKFSAKVGDQVKLART
jgi:S-adenosylmethionine hydrolase